MKNIYIYNEKRKKKKKKKFGAEIWKLLLHNLYCKEGDCIAIHFVSLGLYCRV